MNFKAHLTVGLAGSYITYGLTKSLPVFAFPDAEIIAPIGCAIGSIIPDIDAPNSKVGKALKPISKTIEVLSKPFHKTDENHRGIFHDLGFAVILAVLSYFYFPVLFGFFIGVLSHLILDALNPSGVPFLLFKKVHLLPYGVKLYSGSKSATALSFLIATFMVGGYIVLYQI